MYPTRSWSRRPPDGRLVDLGEALTNLGCQVREAAARAVAEALAGVAHDAATRALLGRRPVPPRRPASAWSGEDYDPWFDPDLDGDYLPEDDFPAPASPPVRSPSPAPGPTALAAALAAAGWRLRRQGPPRAALAVGLVAALAALVGRRLAPRGLSALGAAADLILLHGALAAGAASLARP